MSIWGVGGGMLIYLGALQGIPTAFYEAATLDGAGAWKKLLHITVPMITPVLLLNLVMGVIVSFQVFTQAYVMTDGLCIGVELGIVPDHFGLHHHHPQNILQLGLL